MAWHGPLRTCSLCKTAIPYVLVMPHPDVRGAKAVRVAICPRCDKLTEDDRKKKGGR